MRGLDPWVLGGLLPSIPFHIKREAEFRHHLHRFLGMKRSTHCLATLVGPHRRAPGGGLVQNTRSPPPGEQALAPGEERSQPAYLVLEVWGELPQDGGICTENELLSAGSQAHPPSPLLQRRPLTHLPAGRQGRLLRRTNQTGQGDPLCGTEMGLVGPGTCFCVCPHMCVIVCVCAILYCICLKRSDSPGKTVCMYG